MGIIIGGLSERITFDDADQGNQLKAGETSDVLMLHFPYSVIASALPTTAAAQATVRAKGWSHAEASFGERCGVPGH